ncbi:hypothetical protein AMV213 [Betaentomopoxvirus amoorei]|uniref:AMV213 n=1 Tax=Amsacta moorei entomopoxvirus TaxID=28321 RepID=Q9EMJ3_AMEPV|nr:hypothetical protein AMV213 [Amsacta moorei entomopoxvirus]AAG02919.1 AMV213 [Amsacta moorei entomopoxvirus]
MEKQNISKELANIFSNIKMNDNIKSDSNIDELFLNKKLCSPIKKKYLKYKKIKQISNVNKSKVCRKILF